MGERFVGRSVLGALAVSWGIGAGCAGKAVNRPGGGATDEGGAAGEANAGNGAVASGRGGAAGATGEAGAPAPGTGGTSAGGGSGVGGSGGSSASGGSGAVAGTTSGGTGGAPVVCDGLVCDSLPNVRPGAVVECRNGRCVIPADGCEAPFADCEPGTMDGCETDLADENSCGACDTRCDDAKPICTRVEGEWACAGACIPATPDFCGRCVDLNRDVRDCGSCENDCTRAHAPVACVEGACELLEGECDAGYADCNDEFGCESTLASVPNCGACGQDCSFAHATPDCSRADACGAPSCEPGFANCSLDSPDCETAFGEGCAPVLEGVTVLAGDFWIKAVAYAADGSYAIGGAYYGTQDLDPGPPVDEHLAPLGQAGFISRYSAAGDYLFSVDIGSDLLANVDALAATSDGGFFALGIDDLGHFLLKLEAGGAIGWTRHFDPNLAAYGLAVGAGDSAIVGGGFTNTADLDPGAGETLVSNQTVVVDNAFVTVLDAGGEFVWGRAVADMTLSSPCSVSVLGLSGDTGGGVRLVATAFGFCETGGVPVDGAHVEHYGPSGERVARELPSSPGARLAALFDDGAIALAGDFGGRTDFDPGPALAERTNQDMTVDGYVQRFGSAGDFAHVNVFSHAAPTELAAFSDGALLTLLGTEEVHVLDAGGVDRFAFRVGSGFTAVAAGASEFLLAGELIAEADLDPGPDQELVPPSAYVLRFRR